MSDNQEQLDQFSSETSQMNTKVANSNTTLNNSETDTRYSLFKCPVRFAGFLPDPYDCSCYHYCSGKSNITCSSLIPILCIDITDSHYAFLCCDYSFYFNGSKYRKEIFIVKFLVN